MTLNIQWKREGGNLIEAEAKLFLFCVLNNQC